MKHSRSRQELSGSSSDHGRRFLAPDERLLWEGAPDAAGRGRTNLLFTTRPGAPPPARPTIRNARGFLDLPDADVPAALAALEALRLSATQSPARSPLPRA